MSQVLALKYRPDSFKTLIGQESITQTLSHALDQNRLSHAYLFSGLRGSGKTSTARIFAKALICENGPTSTPCEVCHHCQNAKNNSHIDIIEMDAASNRGIDDIRDLIENTKYKPSSARFKIFIIDEVHMLTTQAFNALLKTLEEPPSYIKFILATTDPLKLPATILSRVQHFRFKQIKANDVCSHLCFILEKEGISYEKEALEMLSRAGNGSLRDTLTLLDQAIIYSNKNITPTCVATMLGLLDPKEVEAIFTAILCGNRNELLTIIKELEAYECEVVIDELIAYLKNAFFGEDRRFSTLLYERFFKIISEAKNLLYVNADNGFILSLLFFKMVEATNIKSVEEMIEQLESQNLSIPTQAVVEDKIAPQNTKITEPLIAKDNGQTSQILFKKLCDRLLDRNANLGEVFSKNITFYAFENGEITLNSIANDADNKIIRTNYSIIKHFIFEFFGEDIKIVVNKISPEEQNVTSAPILGHTQKEPENSHLSAEETKQNDTPNDFLMQEEQLEPSMMLEENLPILDDLDDLPMQEDGLEELPQSLSEEIQEEAKEEQETIENNDPEQFLKHPFVARATTLFEAQNIHILQKV